MLNQIDLTVSFNHHQIRGVDMGFKDHFMVRNFIGVLQYFGHELQSINLKAVSTTDQQWKFR